MLAKAQELMATSGKTNIEFVESRITKIALSSGIADCIISNCVVNLVPADEKQLAFDEMFRLLKPGGRVAISDILAKKPLSADIKRSMSLYVGCVAGASLVIDYERYLRDAGLTGTSFRQTKIYDVTQLTHNYRRCIDHRHGCRLERVSPARSRYYQWMELDHSGHAGRPSRAGFE